MARTGYLCFEDFKDVGKAGSFIGQLGVHSFITIETLIVGGAETYRVWYTR